MSTTNTPTATASFYTVVYQVIGDRAVHNAWWQGLQPMFLADGVPISIVTIAKGDLAQRVDELEAEHVSSE